MRKRRSFTEMPLWFQLIAFVLFVGFGFGFLLWTSGGVWNLDQKPKEHKPLITFSEEKKPEPKKGPKEFKFNEPYVLMEFPGTTFEPRHKDDPMFVDDLIAFNHVAIVFTVHGNEAKEGRGSGISHPIFDVAYLRIVSFFAKRGMLPDGVYCLEYGWGPQQKDNKRVFRIVLMSKFELDSELMKQTFKQFPEIDKVGP